MSNMQSFASVHDTSMEVYQPRSREKSHLKTAPEDPEHPDVTSAGNTRYSKAPNDATISPE